MILQPDCKLQDKQAEQNNYKGRTMVDGDFAAAIKGANGENITVSSVVNLHSRIFDEKKLSLSKDILTDDGIMPNQEEKSFKLQQERMVQGH